ncbi:hypothetical protein GCK32_011184, partial [Trichostrongylus colubriformis]
EKQTLTKNKKQQVARTAGGVCHRVSEVIDLLSTTPGKDTKVKKAVPRPASSESGNKENENEKKLKKQQVQPKRETKVNGKTTVDTSIVPEEESVSKEGISSDDDSTDEEVECVPVVKSKKRPATQSAEVDAKKTKFDVKPVQCETKDRTLDIMEQREQAIRKLQEKLKIMK